MHTKGDNQTMDDECTLNLHLIPTFVAIMYKSCNQSIY